MIPLLHPDDSLVPREILDLPHVVAYLATLEAEAPGLDLTADRALVLGYLAIREDRAGRLDEHRALARRTFDGDEFDCLIAAAIAFLGPFPVPFDVVDVITRWNSNARLAATLG